MNRQDYVAEINKQLDDAVAYTMLPSNPLPELSKKIAKSVKKWHDDCLLTDLEYKFLNHEFPTSPGLHILSKVHKPGALAPGRPIISGINSPTEKMSEFIDHFLQPYVINLPSYLQDT